MNSSSVVLWLKLNQFIDQTIYMNVYQENFSFFSGNISYLGEAPQLSPTFAQYDNGAKVFLFYTNYSTPTTGGIKITGTVPGLYTANDGLTIYSKGNTSDLNNEIIYPWLARAVTYQSFVSSFTGTGHYAIYLSNFTTPNYKLIWVSSAGMKSIFTGTTFGSENRLINQPNTFNGTSFIPYTFANVSVAMPTFLIATYSAIKLYLVEFSENGLPSGARWSVDVGTVLRSSNSQSIKFELTNGSYHYSIGNETGFTGSPLSSNISVEGANLSISITFSKIYAVTFLESGLEKGTVWNVTFGKMTKTSDNSSIIFHTVNGTYNYSVGKIDGTSLVNSNGRTTVEGQNVSVFLRFQIIMQFTFIETGLPSNTHWTVDINGTYYNSSSPFLFVNLTNGSYRYEITFPFGYSANPETGILNPNNTVVIVKASSFVGYEIGVPVFAVVVVALLLLRSRNRKKEKDLGTKGMRK
ncbi:MAG: hypothetical protein M1290_01925 [Candidatus Thermoplasmatota archaeon]|jgi:hypothetical protein|nr:hypothetical protein [Candidatus Thermoplasmatota archaeon]